jgi:hypothetical protein
MIFRAISLRFEFEARDAVWFPAGKAGNTFRGALGSVLEDGFFAPRAVEGPSGLRDRPRPFVLRAAGLDGRRFERGERFEVRVNVFADEARGAVEEAMGRIEGLGPKRGRVALRGFREGDSVAIDLGIVSQARRVRLRFVTPTELKFEDAVLREPRFDALFARVRDRVGSLCGDGEAEVDYRGLGGRARVVEMTSARIENVEVERRSSRTGQRHGLGGFVGEAEYRGDLGEFVPWLKAAEWTGVGRYTVWGNGALLVTGVSGDDVAIEGDPGG